MKREKFGLLSLSKEHRIQIFSEAGSDKTPPFIQHNYWNRCLCCGSYNDVTRAHLMVNSGRFTSTYEKFGIASGFETDFDGFSERNHIPLCGTLGTRGTCHDAFDNGSMTLVYDPFERKYCFYWPGNARHMKQVFPPKSKLP